MNCCCGIISTNDSDLFVLCGLLQPPPISLHSSHCACPLTALVASAGWLAGVAHRPISDDLRDRMARGGLLGYHIFTPPPVGGQGFVFAQFLSLFLCQQHYEKTAGPICMKFSGKVWSDHGTTWFNYKSVRINGLAGQRSGCLLSPAIAQKVIVIP